jgi:hypothetical protein
MGKPHVPGSEGYPSRRGSRAVATSLDIRIDGPRHGFVFVDGLAETKNDFRRDFFTWTEF